MIFVEAEEKRGHDMIRKSGGAKAALQIIPLEHRRKAPRCTNDHPHKPPKRPRSRKHN